ncbi:RHS repeat domain-containing protein [Proteus cibi]|uniref:RHS repeat domain-containing protein n=1 Tax=Proteus cibi TaxID=2050966 RepID=UPI0035A6D7EC
MVHQHGFRVKTWYYQWNTLNQLIACFNPEGECWRYTYDAFGRRLSKHKVVNNRPTPPLNSPFKDKRVQRVDYLWSGNQMVQETPIYADGTPAYDSQIQWLYQPNEITPTAHYQRGKLHYVVTDHQGTPREIFSEKGIVSWAGRLNTWGQMAFWQSHDNYADNDPEYTECHFRFAGQYEDKESGLYYNRFRYYDKDTGQYISPDPIGLLGGFNPYGYVHCPTGWVDPFGLAGEDCDKLVATLKNTPKKDPPKPNELEALNNAINDIFGGKGIPRIDPKTGKQKVFGGMLENGQKVYKWKGGLEWEVIPGNNRLRLVTKDLGDGRIMVGFGYPH